MSEATATEAVDETGDAPATSDIDALIVQSVCRWAVGITLAILALDLAAIASWPMPDVLDDVQGPFYGVSIVLTLIGTAITAFAGYRFVTLNVVRKIRVLFVIFLPTMALISSVVGFLLLTAPR